MATNINIKIFHDIVKKVSESAPAKPVVIPVDYVGSHRTGSLSSKLPVKKIVSVLGFAANVEDDPDKVKHSWGFTVDGEECAIWDYKGSRWSTFGPKEAFVKLFGSENVE